MKLNKLIFIIPMCFSFVSCNKNDGKTIIILARHAQTTANVDNILAGRRLDVHLTEKGIEQAKALGKKLAIKYTFNSCYSSTLSRTYETGLIALKEIPNQIDLPINRVSGLDDVDYGDATGLTVEEADIKYGGIGFPDSFGPIDDPDFVPSFTQENTFHWYQRFQSSLNEIGNNEKGKTTLVVTHGAAFYWGQYNFGNVVTGLGNAGYAELLYKNGCFHLIEWHP